MPTPVSWGCVHPSHALFPPEDELRPKTLKSKVLLNHRDYGGKTRFSGKAVTISCHETNQILREVRNPYPGTRSKVEGSYVQHQQHHAGHFGSDDAQHSTGRLLAAALMS